MEFKHFKADEIAGLDLELVKMLDRAREKAELPFIITSGYRTKEQNAKVGGVENSAHREGKAVDLKCSNSMERLTIITALIEENFCRIGIAKDHIHVDISKELPPYVLFLE